jgi:hypothetical protein
VNTWTHESQGPLSPQFGRFFQCYIIQVLLFYISYLVSQSIWNWFLCQVGVHFYYRWISNWLLTVYVSYIKWIYMFASFSGFWLLFTNWVAYLFLLCQNLLFSLFEIIIYLDIGECEPSKFVFTILCLCSHRNCRIILLISSKIFCGIFIGTLLPL